MFGLNQAECCDGETAAVCPTPSATVAGRGRTVPSPPPQMRPMEPGGQ